MVSIRLVRQSTGAVIAKTEVTVWQGGGYRATTNDQGIAHFENVTPGRHTVYAEGKDLGEHHLEGTTVLYL